MKKILSKVFKTPAVIFSAGVIAAFALFVFLQPQKPAVGIAEANSTKAATPQTATATAQGQESAFLPTTSIPPENSDDSRDFGCFKGYKNWPHSATLKTNAEWSTLDMPGTNVQSDQQPRRNFIDLNGDGLLDFVFSHSYVSNSGVGYYYRFINECVMLNNGTGWDIVFKCLSANEQYDKDFYGDCAQQ